MASGILNATIEGLGSLTVTAWATTKHVLVVDDSSTFRRAICKSLQSHGFDCRQASDGVMALQELHKTDFDLVLTDYQMPEMNGLEFLEVLAAQDALPHPPIRIMMTGTSDETIYQQALNAGALLVLFKTGDFHFLVDQVIEVLESDTDNPPSNATSVTTQYDSPRCSMSKENP